MTDVVSLAPKRREKMLFSGLSDGEILVDVSAIVEFLAEAQDLALYAKTYKTYAALAVDSGSTNGRMPLKLSRVKSIERGEAND